MRVISSFVVFLALSLTAAGSFPTWKGTSRKSAFKAAVDQEVKALRPVADLDKSGFVTTEEGAQFRQLVEFGYLAAAVIENGTPTVAAIAKASGSSEAQVRSRLKEYSTCIAAVKKAGLESFPVVAVEK